MFNNKKAKIVKKLLKDKHFYEDNMEGKKQTFNPDCFDWEEYDRQSNENIKKLQKVEQQIEEMRNKEHELVSKMTDEERKQYTKQKYDRINSDR